MRKGLKIGLLGTVVVVVAAASASIVPPVYSGTTDVRVLLNAISSVPVSAQIIENFVDVEITDVQIEATTIEPRQHATVSVALKNKSPFQGSTNVGILIPGEISGSCSVDGAGSEYFNASEEKTIELKVTNTGSLFEDKTLEMTINIENDEPMVTDSKTVFFTLQGTNSSTHPEETDQQNGQGTVNVVDWTWLVIVLVVAASVAATAIFCNRKRKWNPRLQLKKRNCAAMRSLDFTRWARAHSALATSQMAVSSSAP